MRHGDPLINLLDRPAAHVDQEAAFFSRVVDEGECWGWLGSKDGTGYGRFAGVASHRWAFEFLRAEIPEGLHLDHLCRNRACVNPWHLEPVTNHVNILRGVSPTAINARKTHCYRGHEFTPENTYLYGPRRTWRKCRECQKQHTKSTA